MFKVLRDRENILSQGMSTRYYGIKVAYVRLPRKARTAISKKYRSWWMPWRTEPMKDAESLRKSPGSCNQTLIRGFSLTLRLGINNLLEEYAQALPDDPRLLLRKAHSLELGAISLGLLTYQPDGNVVDYHSHNR
jgi:hypothetical protein